MERNTLPSTTQPSTAKRPKQRSCVFSAVIALMMLLAGTSRSSADELHRLATNKLAEMTALVRHSEACPQVPREWTIAYLLLLMMAPPTEAQVDEQEREMLALRDKIGSARWCQLYSAEMKEAYLIYQQATRR